MRRARSKAAHRLDAIEAHRKKQQRAYAKGAARRGEGFAFVAGWMQGDLLATAGAGEMEVDQDELDEAKSATASRGRRASDYGGGMEESELDLLEDSP